MTNKHIITFLLISLLLLGTIVTVAYSAKAGPIATVEDTQFNFDTVIEGQDIEHSFVIKNTGSAPLVILNVHTG